MSDQVQSEIEGFITECRSMQLNGDNLKERYLEDVTADIVRNATIVERRRLRDFLENNGVPCGRGSRDSIQGRLLQLLSSEDPQPDRGTQEPTGRSVPGTESRSETSAKRDFLKITRYKDEKYAGPYEGPLLESVQRRFEQDCQAFDVPDPQRLSLLYTMLVGEPSRFFTTSILPVVSTVEEAFEKLQQRYLSSAHRDRYIQEWNGLKFRNFFKSDKSLSQSLDDMFVRARDIQAVLKEPYNSQILLRDTIIRAVREETFYSLLAATDIPEDPNTLHTRLQQCIQKTDARSGKSGDSVTRPDNPTYLFDDQEVIPFDDEYDIYYGHNGPMFKRRIMRQSSSFNPSSYRGRSRFRPGFRSGFRPGSYNPSRSHSPRRFGSGPRKNPTDRNGNVMLCSCCNSWFHLVADCPDRQEHSHHVHWADQDAPTDIPANQIDHPVQDDDIMEFSTNFAALDLTQHDQNGTVTHKQNHHQILFMSDVMALAFHMDFEAENPSSLYCEHPQKVKVYPHPSRLAQIPCLAPLLGTRSIYHGLCLDEGAPSSVTGLQQWFAYLLCVHVPESHLQVQQVRTGICFGGNDQNRVKAAVLGAVTIRVPLPGDTFLDYESILIEDNVPMLLGLDTQTRLQAVTSKSEDQNRILFRKIGVTLKLTLKFKHLYYEFPTDTEILFSFIELAQMHKNFGHAPPGSVYSVLKRGYPIETSASDLTKLLEITAQCKGCQFKARGPNRTRVLLPEHCVFNFDVALDVMFEEQKPILQAVCRQTHFSRAAVTERQTSKALWETFMRIWVIPYLGVPTNVWVDQAKAFLSAEFKECLESLGCKVIPIAVEAHWSLICERYHDPLRRIVQKLRAEHPEAPLDLLVDYANMAMSHTVGPEGFTPAILAFGAQPRLPIGNYEQMPQSVLNRMDLMTLARREYEAIVAKLRIRKALQVTTPNESSFFIKPGDEVLVYRKKKGWDGPYIFLYHEGRLSVVLDKNNLEHQFHSTMLKPYTRPYIMGKDLLDVAEADSEYGSVEQTESVTVQLMTVVKNPNDPRFTTAKQAEYDGIVAKGGVKPVLRSELPRTPNFIGNRYVLGIKEPGTDYQRFKARWILQGHTDMERFNIASNSPMLMRMMLRVLVSFAVIFFQAEFWTRDVEQAYFQSQPLNRDVYTEPPPEAKLSRNYVLKVILPHQGLTESGTCWFDTYYPVFLNDMGMNSAPFDPCFLYLVKNNQLVGITGLATDDSANTGNRIYVQAEEKATAKFKTRKEQGKNLRLLGFFINCAGNTISMDQHTHIERLQTINQNDPSPEKFRSVRGQLLFIAQSSRPDVAYSVAQLCQVPYKEVQEKHIRILNETVEHLKNTSKLALQYPILDKQNLSLYVFVDAGYNTNADGTSQLGFIIFIVDRFNKCHFIHWSSSKCSLRVP